MDNEGVEELTRAYLVARLNVEKSERAVGHLARFLARRAMVLRLAAIAAERHPERDAPTAAPTRAGIDPVPSELAEALRELRVWRDAARLAYQRLPEQGRGALAFPPTPWSARRFAALSHLA